MDNLIIRGYLISNTTHKLNCMVYYPDNYKDLPLLVYLHGAGCVPIKTDRGWIHIAHGVRNTAAGLRYVLYAFATDLNDPAKIIAEPSGYLIAPIGKERVGDVSNVVFSNGAIVEGENIYIYYASSDTRLHVATTTIPKLIDYVFNTPKDPLRSADCVRQRDKMINENLKFLDK